MIKKQILVLLITMLFASKLFAQDSLSQKFTLIIKTDIALPILGNVADFKAGSLTLELGLKQRHSIQATGLLGTINYSSGQQNKVRRVITMYKYFLSNEKEYTGFYTGVYLKGTLYNSLIDKTQTPYNYYFEYQQTALHSGFVFGHQHYIRKRIVIDFICGIGAGGILDTKIIKSENVVEAEFIKANTPLDFLFAINLGYKF